MYLWHQDALIKLLLYDSHKHHAFKYYISQRYLQDRWFNLEIEDLQPHDGLE